MTPIFSRRAKGQAPTTPSNLSSGANRPPTADPPPPAWSPPSYSTGGVFVDGKFHPVAPSPSPASSPASPSSSPSSSSSSTYADDFIREEPEPRPGLLGLVVLLFFRPRRFFKNFSVLPAGNALWILALSCGLAAVLTRASTRGAAGFASSDAGTWTEFWPPILLFGLFWGLIIYFLGDWWFRKCLRWSGDRSFDKATVRKVFLWSGQVEALPVIINALAGTFIYSRPSAWAAADFGAFDVLIMVLSLWALVVNYIGVRTVFNVRRGRARFWFLAFPLILALVILSMAVGAALMSDFSPYRGLDTPKIGGGQSPKTAAAAAGATPSEPYRLPRPYSFEKTNLAKPKSFEMPNLADPNSFSSRTMSFSYPGNWTILKKDVPFEPDSTVWVQAPCGSVQGILLYTSALGEQAALDFGVDSLSKIYQSSTEVLSFDKWGTFTGMGRSFQGKEGDLPVTLRVFATAVSENLILEIREVLFDKTLQSDGPGHELIRNSLKLTVTTGK